VLCCRQNPGRIFPLFHEKVSISTNADSFSPYLSPACAKIFVKNQQKFLLYDFSGSGNTGFIRLGRFTLPQPYTSGGTPCREK